MTVAAHATQTLAAGAYGQVSVLDGSKQHPTVLVLSGGVYQLKELDLGDQTRLECTAACEVRVQGRFQAGDKVFVGPTPCSGLSAKDVQIFAEAQTHRRRSAKGPPSSATWSRLAGR